ncbi:MAG: heat-inducible transcription repressor HrcA [Actinomycetales bacterium]|nr:heat-inducible transcription repressor HrcA [Actinomycetales bacterium]
MDERRLAVLCAIVREYVATREPVGSRTLAERHGLAVSPATIRNDMAALEEEGLIAQPHTSAGRVPTDAGYRVFVDQLSRQPQRSGATTRSIARYLGGAVDLDDMMQRTVRLLAQLTHQIALVQYPSLARATVRHCDVVVLTAHRLMIVVVADTGRLDQIVVEADEPIDELVVATLRAGLREALVGASTADLGQRLAPLMTTVHPDQRDVVEVVCAALTSVVTEPSRERVVMGGTANVAPYGEEFEAGYGSVLATLDERLALVDLLGDGEDAEEPIVRIGRENRIDALRGAAVVTAGYGPQATVVAHLGVLGPIRMDYAAAIGSVRAVARHLGGILPHS